MNSPKVLADTINPNEGTSTAVQPSSQDKDNSEPSTQSGATQDENIDSNAAVQERSDNSVTEPATTTNAEEKWQQIPKILRKIKTSRQMRMKLRKILPMSTKKILK